MPRRRLPLVLTVGLLSLWSVGSFAASKKVLVIGIDGAGGRYVQEALAPNLDALAATGAGRYDYYNEGGMIPNAPDAYGASGVNWSTILTGVGAAKHSVTDNSFAGSNFTTYPHFFQHAKQANPSLVTVSLANWTPINTFITPNAFANIEIGYDSGTLTAQDTLVKNDAVSILTSQNPDAMFLHFDQVDGAGHSFGWGSAQHLAAIATVDGLVGQVMSALRARPGAISGAEDWLVIVTADHGAARGATGHVASQGVENWETPFLLNGPSIAPGTPLARGSLRDVATTALYHLGVDPFLAGQGLDGVIRGLPILPPSGVLGDLNGDGVLSGDGSGPGSIDDVTRFLDNWLVAGVGGVPTRYARGDVNLDGVTNLADWAVLNRLNPSIGAAVATRLAAVPEPAAGCLMLLGVVAATNRCRRTETKPFGCIAARGCYAAQGPGSSPEPSRALTKRGRCRRSLLNCPLPTAPHPAATAERRRPRSWRQHTERRRSPGPVATDSGAPRGPDREP